MDFGQFNIKGTVELTPFRKTEKWPDPTPEMLKDARFEKIWQALKTWDVQVPGAYFGYMGATGNHARAIFDALGFQAGSEKDG